MRSYSGSVSFFAFGPATAVLRGSASSAFQIGSSTTPPFGLATPSAFSTMFRPFTVGMSYCEVMSTSGLRR